MAKNLISGPILDCLAQIWVPNFFSWVLPILDVRYCCKLSLNATSRKRYDPNSRKWRKTSFWAWFRSIGPKFRLPNFFLKNLTSSITRYHGQLSSCTISEKTNDSILRKFSDWRKDGRTDGQTDRQTRVVSWNAVRLTSSVQ